MLTTKRTLDGIMKVFNKAAAELEVFITQKSEEARDNAAKAAEHTELSKQAMEEGNKARSQLERLKSLITI